MTCIQILPIEVTIDLVNITTTDCKIHENIIYIYRQFTYHSVVVVKSYIASKQTSDMRNYLLLSIFVNLTVRSWPQTTIIRDGKSYNLAVQYCW